MLLCNSPRLQTRSCGSRPAWRDHQTASAPSCTGWAELKTAADFFHDVGTKHPFLSDGKEILQRAGSHNTPSWSGETNREKTQSRAWSRLKEQECLWEMKLKFKGCNEGFFHILCSNCLVICRFRCFFILFTSFYIKALLNIMCSMLFQSSYPKWHIWRKKTTQQLCFYISPFINGLIFIKRCFL